MPNGAATMRQRGVEADIDALEDIRFMNGRAYNYSAVVEAMQQTGFDDIDAGDGSGPFNPPVPPQVAEQVKHAITGWRSITRRA